MTDHTPAIPDPSDAPPAVEVTTPLPPTDAETIAFLGDLLDAMGVPREREDGSTIFLRDRVGQTITFMGDQTAHLAARVDELEAALMGMTNAIGHAHTMIMRGRVKAAFALLGGIVNRAKQEAEAKMRDMIAGQAAVEGIIEPDGPPAEGMAVEGDDAGD